MCLIRVILLKLGYLAIDFMSCHARLITIQYKENSKLRKLKFYAITELSRIGVQFFLQMGMSRMRLKSPNSKQYNQIEFERLIIVITV